MSEKTRTFLNQLAEEMNCVVEGLDGNSVDDADLTDCVKYIMSLSDSLNKKIDSLTGGKR